MSALLRRAFSNFWSVNVGHVSLSVVFVFGLGAAWRNVAATQDADRSAAQNRDEAIVRSIEAAVNERNLKLAALAERIAREEAQDADRAAQGRQLAEVGAQMRSLEDQIKALREDLRTYQVARR